MISPFLLVLGLVPCSLNGFSAKKESYMTGSWDIYWLHCDFMTAVFNVLTKQNLALPQLSNTTQLRNTSSINLTRDLPFLLDIYSPYSFPYIPVNISCENLVLYQYNVSLLMNFFFLITFCKIMCWFVWRIYFFVTLRVTQSPSGSRRYSIEFKCQCWNLWPALYRVSSFISSLSKNTLEKKKRNRTF